MLKNSVVFILSNAKYDAPIESTGYTIAKHLAKHNQVFYVEYPATLKDYYQLKKSPEFAKKKALYSKDSNGILDTENPNLKIVITSLLLSINFLPEGFLYRTLLNYNEHRIVRRIKSVIKLFGIDDFIFINSFNIHYPNVGKLLSPKLNVYHCVDPLVSGYDTKHGLLSEQTIVANSDLVICTSKKLYDINSERHSNTRFVPNAADFEHSQKATLAQTPILPGLSKIKKPIIGFLGNIEGRTDFELITAVAEKNPDKSFVFVGPIAAVYAAKLISNKNNIHLIGAVQYAQMPEVLKGFDIAIIPFRKDEFSSTIFPLKLFEYLGSGKPVISTNFNTDLNDQTKDTVPFCATADEFSDAINDALDNDNEEKKAKRLIVAQNNTWEKRGDEFSNLLAENLKAKNQK
ncbi:glycosyltransferase [Pedobacter arcticus]|uniref:glycosyltransferase n=1 Tax=Pedobacter arcticus TaxID=752140 RepID=UPI0002FFD552|nr:glycosyltransferase [Pedobacter arcticus]